jgi:plasmid maintenance system antidote protein VapI
MNENLRTLNHATDCLEDVLRSVSPDLAAKLERVLDLLDECRVDLQNEGD